MSSIKCPKCQNELNSTDIFCSQCGYSIKNEIKGSSEKKPHKAPQKNNNGCGIALFIFIAFLFITFLIKTCSKSENISNSTASSESTYLSKEDSIKNKARVDSIDKQQKIEEEKFLKTKAGKIYKKHSDWSKEDCIKIADHRIWIGMHYDMLVYMRGKPNNVNTSNYGDGPHYQACWYDYDPSCFYFDDTQIITSYN